MKPVGRVRTVSRWVCTVLAILMAVVAVASRWWRVEAMWYTSSGLKAATVGGGLVQLTFFSPQYAMQAGWRVERFDSWNWGWRDNEGLRGSPVLRWHFGVAQWNDRYWTIYSMSVVYPAFAGALWAGVLWGTEFRRRRRARPNLCGECGYDRSGLAGDKPCPECGTSAAV